MIQRIVEAVSYLFFTIVFLGVLYIGLSDGVEGAPMVLALILAIFMFLGFLDALTGEYPKPWFT